MSVTLLQKYNTTNVKALSLLIYPNHKTYMNCIFIVSIFTLLSSVCVCPWALVLQYLLGIFTILKNVSKEVFPLV